MTARTRITALVAATALTLTVAACSDDDSSDNSSTGTTAAQEGSFPATVATKFGDVDVKEQPRKIVALGWGDAEIALDMGAQPIAASDWLSFGGDGTGPWAQSAYDNPPELINTLDPSYEKIAELNPDLILDVKSSGDQERYDKLSAIAPTVGVPDGADAFTVDYDDHVKMIAEALGKPELADEITKKHQDKLAEVRDKHPEWKGKTVSVLAAGTEGWGAYLGAYGLTDYGFTENPKIADRKPGPDGLTGGAGSRTDRGTGHAEPAGMGRLEPADRPAGRQRDISGRPGDLAGQADDLADGCRNTTDASGLPWPAEADRTGDTSRSVGGGDSAGP